jgi:hypothetical protein
VYERSWAGVCAVLIAAAVWWHEDSDGCTGSDRGLRGDAASCWPSSDNRREADSSRGRECGAAITIGDNSAFDGCP